MATMHTITAFEDPAKAERALDALQEQGFDADDIGLMMSESARDELTGTAPSDLAAEGALAGGAFGAFVGGLVALAAGPPGFLAGGALVALLSGAVGGGVAGSLVGMLHGLGVPEERATELEERLRAGDIVVTATSGDPSLATVAEHTLRKQDPVLEVRTYTSAR